MILDPWRFIQGRKRQHPYAFVVAVARVGNQTWTATNGKHQHAEEAVLKMVPRGIDGRRIHLWVFRISTPPPKKVPTLTMAKPCEKCQSLLWKRGVTARRTRFINWSGNWERMSNEERCC